MTPLITYKCRISVSFLTMMTSLFIFFCTKDFNVYRISTGAAVAAPIQSMHSIMTLAVFGKPDFDPVAAYLRVQNGQYS
jgi:hypothetical protein